MAGASRVGWVLVAAATSILGLWLAACGGAGGGGEKGTLSSLAYKGHESDLDMLNFVNAHPQTYGTRLDDCQTCHTGGDVDDGDRIDSLNPCSFCHLIPYPDEDLVSGAPTGYAETLNPYGLAYKAAGRNLEALQAILGADSDGDAFTNVDEIVELRYPGDPTSMPGQAWAPTVTLEWTEVASLASHTQFLLMNSHRQQFDDYASYDGVRMTDLLAAVGADLSGATSLTVIAPDGYAKDFALADVGGQFPDGLYYADLGPGDFPDPNQGFVKYPVATATPAGLVDGGVIPGEQWMILAYGRDGGPLDPSYLDPVSGKMDGEGPFRLVIPQVGPGSPDRGSKYSPTAYGDGWDYDDTKDHNAGLCVRGVVAIRVNPMPPGYEEFDWKNGGWALSSNGRLIVYGAGISGD